MLAGYRPTTQREPKKQGRGGVHARVPLSKYANIPNLIARGFEHIGYPILPRVEKIKDGSAAANGYSVDEICHIRHHSLYMPRDFDVSPFFDVVKPTLPEGFNYKDVAWAMPRS
jgi:hypothetical protein